MGSRQSSPFGRVLQKRMVNRQASLQGCLGRYGSLNVQPHTKYKKNEGQKRQTKKKAKHE